MTPVAEWTFMVYMAGDNSLSAAGDADLAEMRRVGSNDRVHIVVEFDNAGPSGTRRFHIEREGAAERTEQLPETDSGDPAALLAFVSWVASEYPARRYALVLWNHGGGWAPADLDSIARSIRAPDFGEGEAAQRSAGLLGRVFFRNSLQSILAQRSARERAICSDDGSGHSLDTLELETVLSECVAILGRPLDLLGFDACLMSNIEVAYQIRRQARVLVGSEETAPDTGWPYERVLSRLTAGPDMTAVALAAAIVDDYVDSHLEVDHAGDLSQAAIDLSRVGEVVDPLDELASRLSDHMPTASHEIWHAQRRSTRFFHDTLWDASHFCARLEEFSADASVRSAAAASRAALATGPRNCIVAERHHGAGVALCHGLSIYLPPPTLKRISRFYPDLAFARERRWLDLLRAYHGR